jgi:2-oxoglutarate dehydrogenase E2 component (dihydrolipoamide succinyltransferase)
MSVELKVPSAGESITEVTIVEWLKDEGAWADRDETVALIETDKANVEVSAPVAGHISKIVKNAGDVAEVGEVIGTMEEGGEKPAASEESAPKGEAPAERAAEASSASASGGGGAAASERREAARAPSTSASGSLGERQAPARSTSGNGAASFHAPPSVRRVMREHNLSADQFEGTGPGGRITSEDIRRHARAEPAGGSREEDRVRMTPLRKRIAGRLVEAQQGAALLTTFNEIDMTNVMQLRKAYQEQFVEKHGIKLGFMSFFVKAVIEGLKEYPQINAWLEGDDIVYHNYYDVGVAVGGGRGLVVPVIRNAERLSFAQLEKTIADFGQRAKQNRLNVDELEGGTFTISNGGIYGSLMSTPIINPPQSGILGMHAIQDRPVVRDGQIVVGKMMYVALTYDHRIVDGREAVSFLVRVKEVIENPNRLLLEV